jgi:uncharacterized protein YecE (DUF72 family)
LVDHSFNNVVEFRHASWWSQEVLDAFERNNIAFSGMSHPTLPVQVVRTTDIVYYRFHGVPHLYASKYPSEELEKVAQQIQSMPGLREAYIFFNNTAEAAAVTNAKQLRELCQEVSREH